MSDIYSLVLAFLWESVSSLGGLWSLRGISAQPSRLKFHPPEGIWVGSKFGPCSLSGTHRVYKH